MTTKLAGTFVGAAVALAAGSASAEPIYTLEVHPGDFAGRAYNGEDEYRNNNDQLGAGLEHVRCTQLKSAAGGARLMCIGTGSYTDIPNSPVQDRIQGLCISHKLDAQQGLVQTAIKYISENYGDEYQNFHAPTVTPLFGGTMAAVLYNYDPNNNTELYGKIVDADCNPVTEQTLIFRQDNDNVLGQASPPILLEDTAGKTRVGMCGIGNGNGNDDMWCLGIRATVTNGTYKLERYFAKVVENQEERSRPIVAATTMADKMFECAAVGDNQPPDYGLRCSLVDTAENTPNEQRVVWRRYIQERQGRIYATTPALAPILTAEGLPTDTYVVSYVEVDLTNRNNNREKGETSLKTVAVQALPDRLEILETPKYDMVGFGDQAHQHMCAINYGPNAEPATLVVQGSVVGSVTGVARGSIIKYDAATRSTVRGEDMVFADSKDTGWIPRYYGNNPNTPQGRNHGFCSMMDNPGYGVAGGFMPTVKSFIMEANTPRRLRADGLSAEDKLAFELVLIPAVIPDTSEPDPDPDPEPDPDPDPQPEPEPDPDGSGAQVGGCSAGGGAGGGLALLGLAFAFTTIRRRRAK